MTAEEIEKIAIWMGHNANWYEDDRYTFCTGWYIPDIRYPQNVAMPKTVKFDPLTDSSQAFLLAAKLASFMRDNGKARVYWTGHKNGYCFRDTAMLHIMSSKDPFKAICHAILDMNNSKSTH